MPIPFAAIPGILSVAQSGFNLYQGFKQNQEADSINPIRKKYRIPSEITSNVRMAENLAASQRLPGQGVAENRIRENSANALDAIMKSATSGGDILNAASGINRNQNNAFNDLNVQAAEMQMANKDRLSHANQVMAGYRDQAFDYNVNQPYLMDLARKQALQQAGAENMNNALTGLTNVTSSFVGSDLLGSESGNSFLNVFKKPKPGNAFSGVPNMQPFA